MADPLDLVHLRTLVAIAETGGFRRAADALHLSQPSVSQHVRLLEKRLKQTLVVKDGRGSRFTASGDRLVHEARLLLAAHDESLERLQVHNARQITIGSTEHAADRLLPELLGVLRATYPKVRLQFRLDRSTALADAVSKGTLDLAVILGDNPETVGTAVGELDLRWVVSSDWHASETRHAFEAGRRLPLVAFEEPCGLRRRATRMLVDVGYEVNVIAESTSLDGVLAAARAGLGVALLPFSGPVPEGLEELTELPPMGGIDLRLVARRGLSTEVENSAITAVTEHFSDVAPIRVPNDTTRVPRRMAQLHGVA